MIADSDSSVNDSIDTTGFDLDDEEGLTIQEMYAQLMLAGELIFTLPKIQYDAVRTGLINAKAKGNTKFKDEGIATEYSRMRFNELSLKEGDAGDKELDCKMHVTLQKRQAFNIKKVEKPSNEL